MNDFSAEQRRYLEGLVAGMSAARAVPMGGAPEPIGPDAPHLLAMARTEAAGKKLSDQQVQQIHDATTFESMSANEWVNHAGARSSDYWKGKFMRTGIVGDWRNYFSDELAAEFDAKVKEALPEELYHILE